MGVVFIFLKVFFNVKEESRGFTCGRGIQWKVPIIVKKGKLMEKYCKIQITDNTVSNIKLKLKNTIDFKRYFWWRNDYKQAVFVKYNNISKKYVFENNRLNINLDFSNINKKNIEIKIKTKYVLPYIFKKFGYVESGILLEE